MNLSNQPRLFIPTHRRIPISATRKLLVADGTYKKNALDKASAHDFFVGWISDPS
jgi:hypothetical protein